MKVYVGNLPFRFEDAELKELFERFGQVDSARIVTDRETGRSRGFGFVEMTDDGQARQAIEALHDQECGGRRLVVNEARPREDRPRLGGARAAGVDEGPARGFDPSRAPDRRAGERFRDRGDAGGREGRRDKDDWGGGDRW